MQEDIKMPPKSESQPTESAEPVKPQAEITAEPGGAKKPELSTNSPAAAVALAIFIFAALAGLAVYAGLQP